MENVKTKVSAEEKANKQQANLATKSGRLRNWSHQVPLKLKVGLKLGLADNL